MIDYPSGRENRRLLGAAPFKNEPQGAIQVQSCSSSSNLKEEREASTVRISVVIPALNEEKMIGRCLECLARSSFPPDSFEVIVVDNGSTDRTLEIAHSFSRQLSISTFQQSGVHISALRNLGAAASKGEILAFLDADCMVPEDWLERAFGQLHSETAGVVGSYYAIPSGSRWVARTWYGAGHPPKDGNVAYVPSGDMLVRRSTFFQLRGFDEHLETSEDCEFCLRARKAGLLVHAVAGLAVIHLGTPQTLGQFYRKHLWHGTHVAKVYFQNKQAVTHLRAVAFAIYMLLSCAGVLTGLGLALIFGKYVFLAVALAAMIAAPLASSVRMLSAAHGRTFWRSLLPITALHVVYGMARAAALLGNRVQSK
jgi:GT2 family glycosyltransferase